MLTGPSFSVLLAVFRDEAGVSHQHLLRTMDTLMGCADALEAALATLLRPLLDQELSIVFYDLTTIRAEGSTEMTEELRRFGPSKEGGIARQVMLGVVQTATGLTSLSKEQRDLFDAIDLPEPAVKKL